MIFEKGDILVNLHTGRRHIICSIREGYIYDLEEYKDKSPFKITITLYCNSNSKILKEDWILDKAWKVYKNLGRFYND